MSRWRPIAEPPTKADRLNDHELPHFHAEHQGLQGKFDFNGEMLVGAIDSRTALRLIREWATLHRGELEDNWHLAKIRQPLRQVAPLE